MSKEEKRNVTAQSLPFTTLRKLPYKNIVGKGENAGNQHSLLFPQCFLPFPYQIFYFSFTLILSSANAFNLDQSKILYLGKELSCEVLVSQSM